ncbi:M15 family metallopeptidase domain-containing protein [Actinoplanes sp. RD1]|uniref:hypothetical protein n=1 Tax=Actinoplanes sp. RD1 TaxID=3064538 RepID=UPI002741A259|nr:hypothetical protein [Actinoplanes sp. RD1]
MSRKPVPPTDPRVAAVPVRESGDRLVDVAASAPLRVTAPALLRFGVVERLVIAQSALPRDVRLVVVAGHSSAPTHASGATVDVTLVRDDDALPDLPLLTGALAGAGLVAWAPCWWRWSYGDQVWAYVMRAPHARYGPLP